MNLADAFKVSLSSLFANRLRTALTMLGLTIGAGAVITLMSIGQGAQAAVAS
jgi:putative ABC transport system permease protein